MSWALHSFKVDHDGKIRVAHTFYGETEHEATSHLHGHADICPKFGPAYKANETIEILVEIDELPEADEDSLREFLEVETDDDDG